MILICMLERVVPWLIVAEAGEILSAKSGDGGGGGDWTGTDVPPPQPAMLVIANSVQPVSTARKSPFRVVNSRGQLPGRDPKIELPVEHACENRCGSEGIKPGRWRVSLACAEQGRKSPSCWITRLR